MILLMDKYRLIYKVVKQKGQYYLIQEHFDKYKEHKTIHVIVKGIDNINTYIKNNDLKKIEMGDNNGQWASKIIKYDGDGKEICE